MAIKMLISALPNTGKTTLLQTLTDVLVFSHDGKVYPFPQPHVNINDFETVDNLIATIESSIGKYEAKYNAFPKTIVIDSISKVLLTIEGNILERVSSFPYGVINTEIKKLMDFLEVSIVPNVNLILVSHAMRDDNGFSLVNAGGSWGKKGGVLSEVDQAVFIEIKGNKRVLHHKSPKFLARTTLTTLPDSLDIEDYNLQEHITMLQNIHTEVEEFRLD